MTGDKTILKVYGDARLRIVQSASMVATKLHQKCATEWKSKMSGECDGMRICYRLRI